MRLRDYQEAAVDKLFDYFMQFDGDPIIALPTGTGKSLVIAEICRRALTQYPDTKILKLTHVKELIQQNMDELLKAWPSAPAGIYSAGLNRREVAPITFAGIASVSNKPELFGKINLVLIDECHLVSTKAATRYMALIKALRQVNPKLKVIGLTATPFRLGQGMLTDAGGLFTDICFDLTTRDAFNWMIAQGWICPVVPRKTNTELDISGVQIQSGEFNLDQLQDAVDKDAVTRAALIEAANIAEDREHWLVFTSGIEHAEHVADILNEMGITAATVHSKLSKDQRDNRIAEFKSGRIKAVVNNNVLTTGFNYPKIDCIVMLRPTASPVLWVQMLGRGTRPAPGKKDCLVLDFAGNTRRLGPINDPVRPRRKKKGPPGIAPVRLCEMCGCYSHAAARFCENPDCGAEFPSHVKISTVASTEALIVGEKPQVLEYEVDRVVYRIHQKEGKPDSMRVDYYCGLRRFSEYICLDHDGYAKREARTWWLMRIPDPSWGVPPSVAAGMKAIDYIRVPKKISVVELGKYPQITGYEFD
jgi:DNA repair protein RadD